MAEPSPKLKVPLNMSVDHLEQWAKRAGIPVVPVCQPQLDNLIASGATAWLAVDYWWCTDDELQFALRHATQLIAAPHTDRFFAAALQLAVDGERVVMLQQPDGNPIPLPTCRKVTPMT